MTHRRPLMIVLVALIALTLVDPAFAEPRTVDAKKCFKKKAGKRVRVKCPKAKPKTTPAPTPAPPAPVPMTDPVATDALRTAVNGQMLHHFSTSAFPGDEKLYLCGDGSYAYLATLSPALPGLTGVGKTLERGLWHITGADFSPDRTRLDGGLLLIPADGTPPHLARLSALGAIAFVNDDQWYVSVNGLCGGA